MVHRTYAQLMMCKGLLSIALASLLTLLIEVASDTTTATTPLFTKRPTTTVVTTQPRQLNSSEAFRFTCTRKEDFKYEQPIVIYNHLTSKNYIEPKGFLENNVDLLLLVISPIDSQQQRKLIRSTYGSLKLVYDYQIRLFFAINIDKRNASELEVLNKEAQDFEDLFVTNYSENQHRNSSRIHLSQLEWISRKFGKLKFMSRITDTIFVNTPQMVLFLKYFYKGTTPNDKIYCNAQKYLTPVRKNNIVYAVTPEEWPDKQFPQYCSPNYYITNFNLIRHTLDCAKFLRYLFIDDVWITGDLRQRVEGVIEPLFEGYAYAEMKAIDFRRINYLQDYLLLDTKNDISADHWRQNWGKILKNSYM